MRFICIYLCFLFLLVNNINAQTWNKVQSLSDNNYSDLMFLDSLIADKTIVFLGELHGIEDFNELRFKIVRYLNQKHGFNTIVFESDIGLCGFTDILKDSLKSIDILSHSLMGVWLTESMCSLMTYIRDNKMNLSGMDINEGALKWDEESIYKITKHIEFSKKLVDLDSISTKELFQKKYENFLQNRIVNDTVQLYQTQQKIIVGLKELYQQIDLLEASTHNKQILYKYVENRIRFNEKTINPKIKEDIFGTSNYRDSLMALNLDFIVDSLFPNDKIIVWAHNFHIAKYVDCEKKKDLYNVSVPQYLSNKNLSKSYFIGFFALSGESFYVFNEKNQQTFFSFDYFYKKMVPKAFLKKNTPNAFFINNDAFKDFNLEFYPNYTTPYTYQQFDGVFLLKNVRGTQILKYGHNPCYNCE